MTSGVRRAVGPSRARLFLRSEGNRSWVAALLASMVMALAGFMIAAVLRTDTLWSTIWYGFYITWSLMMVIYTVLTISAFSGLSGNDLHEAAIHSVNGRRHYASEWAATSSVMALILIIALVAVPGLRDNPVLVGCALLMVIACWASMVVSYALHYARQPVEDLGFPDGSAERTFGDYVYVAFAVQTTFGATDVEIRSTPLRRGVTIHGVLAFAYNTVIVAMIISFLVR